MSNNYCVVFWLTQKIWPKITQQKERFVNIVLNNAAIFLPILCLVVTISYHFGWEILWRSISHASLQCETMKVLIQPTQYIKECIKNGYIYYNLYHSYRQIINDEYERLCKLSFCLMKMLNETKAASMNLTKRRFRSLVKPSLLYRL